MEKQITTLTFCRYQGFSNRFFGFKMVGAGHQELKNIQGLLFYKLMGSGKDPGFSIWPDFSVYALLQTWATEEDALAFFDNSSLINAFDDRALERMTVYLKNIRSHGSWNQQNPFKPHPELNPENPYVAVVTRASIRTSSLYRFWRYVPVSQKPVKHAPGLLFTKGIGEVPITQMATFSIWKSASDLNAFAYRSAEHQQAIKLTRTTNWYSEELFARFQPYRSEGSWKGETWDFCPS